jgi:hypothetical protein
MWFDNDIFTSWLSKWLTKWLAKNYGLKKLRRLKAAWLLTTNGVSITSIGDFKMILPVDKSLTFSLSYVDNKGNPAVVDGAPTVTIDRTDLATLTMAADGMSGSITPLGPVGSAQLTANADADLGEGVVALTTIGTVDFVAGTAITGVFNFGEPT